MPKKKTHEEFMKDFEERQPELFSKIEILGEYVRNNINIPCACKICGYGENGEDWKPRPNNLLTGSGCPKCGIAQRVIKRRKSREDFIKELSEINPNVKVLGDYVNNRTGISCECLLCGHGKNGEDWKPQPSDLLAGKGCPKCACMLAHEKQRKTHEDFIKELSEINPNVKVLGDYVGARTGILCECLLCGYGKNGEDWKPRPNDLLAGSGCPKCAHCGASWLQEELFKYFSQKYPSTLYRDKTLIGKELDIVIPELNIAIEPGSWYWHFENENKLSNDYHKQLLCKEKGYTCITLYDACDFPDILWYQALVYDKDIGQNKDMLQQVIQDIEQIIQDHA